MHAFDNLKAAMKAAGHILEEGEGIVLADYHKVKSFLSNIGMSHIGTDFHRFDEELTKLENGGHNLVNVGTQAGEEFVDHSRSLFERSIAGIEKFEDEVKSVVEPVIKKVEAIAEPIVEPIVAKVEEEIKTLVTPPAPPVEAPTPAAAANPDTPHMEGQPPVNAVSATEDAPAPAPAPAPEQSAVQSQESPAEESKTVADATSTDEAAGAPAETPVVPKTGE